MELGFFFVGGYSFWSLFYYAVIKGCILYTTSKSYPKTHL